MDKLETLMLKREKLSSDLKKIEERLVEYRQKQKDLEKDISFEKGAYFGETINKAMISDEEFLRLRKLLSKDPGLLRGLLENEIKILSIEGEEDEEI